MWPESFHVAGLLVLLHGRARAARTSIWYSLNDAFPLLSCLAKKKTRLFFLFVFFLPQSQISVLSKHTSLQKQNTKTNSYVCNSRLKRPPEAVTFKEEGKKSLLLSDTFLRLSACI